MTLSTEYNAWHQQVFDRAPEHADEQSPWYRLVLEHLGPIEGRQVLEIACGRGGFARLLASRGATVFGADFSETATRIAQSKTPQNGKRVQVTQADAEHLPYASASFDIVISCETIEHLLDPGAALAEMRRVCRPGGRLYLTTPNYFNAMGLYYLYAKLRGRSATPGADQPTDHVFLFPKIRGMLRRAGWTVVRSDGTVHQLPVWPGHNPVALPALESSRAIRSLLSPFALHYFVLASNGERGAGARASS